MTLPATDTAPFAAANRRNARRTPPGAASRSAQVHRMCQTKLCATAAATPAAVAAASSTFAHIVSAATIASWIANPAVLTAAKRRHLVAVVTAVD